MSNPPMDRLRPQPRPGRLTVWSAGRWQVWFRPPALVDEQGTIIAGHGRILAAESLGIAEAPVMVAAGWSEAQGRAYVIADNKLALNAGWDPELLPVELGDLKTMGFDLSVTGFDELELGKLLPVEVGDSDPDQAPEPPAEPISNLWG